MADRRSMSDALSLTPEKVAFIERGATISPEQNADTAHSRPRQESAKSTYAHPASSMNESAKSGDRDSSRPTVKSRGQTEDWDAIHTSTARPLIGEHLVPLTTRLQAKTAEGLRRAYLEQRLRQISPATQQEIVEESLQAWLRKRGYLN